MYFFPLDIIMNIVKLLKRNFLKITKNEKKNLYYKIDIKLFIYLQKDHQSHIKIVRLFMDHCNDTIKNHEFNNILSNYLC